MVSILPISWDIKSNRIKKKKKKKRKIPSTIKGRNNLLQKSILRTYQFLKFSMKYKEMGIMHKY